MPFIDKTTLKTAVAPLTAKLAPYLQKTKSVMRRAGDKLGQSSKAADIVAETFGYEKTALKENTKIHYKDHPLMAGMHLKQFANLLPYELYCDETDIYINQETLGFGLEMIPATGADEEFVELFATILTDVLPEKAQVQFLLWGSNKIGPLIERTRANITKRGGEYARLNHLQMDFLKSGVSHDFQKRYRYSLKDFRLYLFVTLPKAQADVELSTMVGYREEVLNAFSSVNLQAVTLKVQTFLSLIKALTNPDECVDFEPTRWDKFDNLSTQLRQDDRTVEVKPNQLRFYNEDTTLAAKSFRVKQFPERAYQWQMRELIGKFFNDALQMPGQFVFCLHIHLLSMSQAEAKVQAKLMANDKKSQSQQMVKWLRNLPRQQRDYEYVQQRMSEGDKLVDTCFSVTVFDAPENLNSAERAIKDLFKANRWQLTDCEYLQMPVYLSMLPMTITPGLWRDLKTLQLIKTMTAFNAVNIAPLQAETKGAFNPLMIYPGRSGQVCGFNPFENEGNFNIAIAANSGKGKSAFAQSYIQGLLGAGGRCWIIDMGHSYQKFCDVLNGEFIEFDLAKPICLNFFTRLKTKALFAESLPALKSLVSMMARTKGETTEEEDSLLERAITAAYEQEGVQATLSSIQIQLKSLDHVIADNLALLLTSYAKGGMYSAFFEGECEIDFDNPLIVIELLKLKDKKDLQKVVLFAVMTQIQQAMYLSDRNIPKSCIIDEAWDLFSGTQSHEAKFIEHGYRTIRRHNGNFLSIVQGVNDYYRNPTAKVAFENSDFTIVLGQKAQSVDELQKTERFPVDGFIKRVLKSLKVRARCFSECLIQSPQGMSVHRILLGPYLLILYSSKGREHAAVMNLIQEGYTIHEAVVKVKQAVFES